MGEENATAEGQTGEGTRHGVANHKTPSPPDVTKGADLTGIFKQMDMREPRGGATDLFRTAEVGRAAADPGFTQIFQSLGQSRGPSVGQAGGQAPAASDSAATQISGLLPASAPGGAPMSAESHRAPAGVDAGEFTQMFERLDGPGAKSREGFGATYQDLQELRPGAQRQPMSGGFTQLLRTLSTESSAALPDGSVVQPAPGGPGEFTRIISRSALRDASQRESQREARTQSDSEVETSVPASGQPVSEQPPRPPVIPLQQVLSQGQAITALASRGVGVGSHPQPIVSGVSSAPVSSIAETTRGGRLQEYVPLLLIANLFAMLVLILLVSVLLVHHH